MDYNPKLVEFGDLKFEPYIDKDSIQSIVEQMAQTIYDDFKEKSPLFIIVLNGAFVFAADLLRKIPFDCESTFVKLKSYQGLESSGNIEKLLGLELDVKDRDIIVIEDIIDTGNTLNEFLKVLTASGAASIKLASLLFKREAFLHNYKIDYIGSSIEDKFVIGYGLDYDNQGRNLNSIYKKVD